MLLATIRPNIAHYDECLNTLQFATRCRNIFNQPRINSVFKNEEELLRAIRELREENISLRALMSAFKHRSDLRLKAIMEQLGIDGELLEDGRYKVKTF